MADVYSPEPELDHLSNILKTFNDQFGDIPWEDEDRVRRLITEEIPAKVAGDTAYRNARENSDRQNARIEHDEALKRVMTAVLNDDMQLFKQFTDNRGVPAVVDGYRLRTDLCTVTGRGSGYGPGLTARPPTVARASRSNPCHSLFTMSSVNITMP